MVHDIDPGRVTSLNNILLSSGPVIYWMSRDQRTADNWALLYAQQLALDQKAPLAVIFCLVPQFLGATRRHYGFMLKGLGEVEKELQALNIGFYLLTGSPGQALAAFCQRLKPGALVTDFSPLRINRRWKEEVVTALNIAFHEVDAHNIVPCRIASPKQEYAAYTIRPKIKKLLPRFLTDLPSLIKHPFKITPWPPATDWKRAEDNLVISQSPGESKYFHPGAEAAYRAMRFFIEDKLAGYENNRNDPTKDGQSNLSPYLHFGQLSAQRLAYLARQAEAPGLQPDAFLEELIVRRELSDNFCFYNDLYDSEEAFPRWARETLAEHLADPRETTYSKSEFESARTHDALWNAAQVEMAVTGKMHGYMRMYWAKKILEWTESPAEAIKIAIYLNDRYSLDGRDPNGYSGIAWSIGGLHDRAWFQRPIFGKIRYMSYRGSKSKFDVQGYINKIKSLEKNQ